MKKNLWQKKDFQDNKEYWSNQDSEISLKVRVENLLLLNNILNIEKIFFFLEGGTLNSIYKNSYLDARDHDDDIGILYRDRKKILKIIHILEDHNFEIIRNNKNMISVYRNKRYIDICLFKKSLFKIGYGKKTFQKKYFKNFDTLIFENTEFNIPNNTDDLLKIRYG